MNAPTDLKSRIAGQWSARSESYDSCFGHGYCDDRHRALWRDALARNAKPTPGLRVLDVGCGTGFLSLQLAAMGCAVTGVDLSADMLARARAKAQVEGANIHFQVGDAENPPFEPATFDLIVCRHVVWTLPDPASALGAWHRLLAPGGRVMPVEGHWSPRTAGERFRRWLGDQLSRVMPSAGHERDWKASYPATEADLPYMGGVSAEELSRALAAAGFAVLGVDGLDDVIAYERSRAPLPRRLQYGPGRRFIIVAQKGSRE